MDEVFLTINGKRHYLWRAVDQDDHVLDILVQRRRNKKAAKKFFKKLLKGLQYVPRVVITDKLKSYAAAKREVMPSAFCLPMAPLPNTFDRAGICCRRRRTVKRWRIDSRVGPRLRVQSGRLKGEIGPHGGSVCLVAASTSTT